MDSGLYCGVSGTGTIHDHWIQTKHWFHNFNLLTSMSAGIWDFLCVLKPENILFLLSHACLLCNVVSEHANMLSKTITFRLCTVSNGPSLCTSVCHGVRVQCLERIHGNLDSGDGETMNMEWCYMIPGIMSSETRGLQDISFFLYLNILPPTSKELFPQERST